ncbi:hypothetical protein [Tessaracoccus sp. OH4464_COT-324]|uniref:hypothetical protein n=1 Tax=Tessaracoccus sp. OH4464_COT-324 TaxID=2491059 RepID=UPI000F63BACE|nr:hypothetical protein [Tessaracoccus sp. OH4464_COT-324]RRD45223.1 hypothetical protein EII42_11345 [Tessaracoccus sp. OH4464_COT-324]
MANKRTRIYEVQAHPQQVFPAVQNALSAATGTPSYAQGNVLRTSSRMSLFSWGENYFVTVEGSPMGSLVTVEIKLPLPTQIIDFGILNRRQDDFLPHLQQFVGHMREVSRS